MLLLRRLPAHAKNFSLRPARCFQTLNDTSGMTEDHFQIQKVALDFAEQKLRPFALEWDQKAHFPVDVVKEAASLGFGAIYTSSEYGGCALDRLSASLIFEALSSADVSTAAYLTVNNMNCWLLDNFGNAEQKKQWLPEITSMNLFSSYCLTEPNSGSDAAAMQTSAKEDGGDFVINGSKCFITCGGVSDLYFVMCLTGQNEKSCIVVPKDTKGLSFGKPEKKMGWRSSPTTTVTFEDVRVPKSNLLGPRGEGFKMAVKALDGGRVNIASCSLGGGAFALDKANRWIAERQQFGKRLNQFQWLQFKLAEMATNLVTARLMVREAARKIDANAPDKSVYAAMAKLFATEKCYDIADYSLQMHGGYGYLAEGGIERFQRDLRVNRILEGTSEVMKLIISRNLIGLA